MSVVNDKFVEKCLVYNTELVDFKRDSGRGHVILADLGHGRWSVGVSRWDLDDVVVLRTFVDDRRVLTLVPDSTRDNSLW